MRPPVDVLASLALGAACIALFAAHAVAGAPSRYRRVKQQGGTFFLGLNLMHAGYWMLQPVVTRCVRYGISATMVSWASLIPAMLAALGAATGHWGGAAWCLLASALLDVLDGAVARATEATSPAGAVLDSVLDRYAEFIFFTGLVVYYRADLSAQLMVLAAMGGSFLVTYSTAKAEALRVTPPRGSMKRSDRLTVLIVGTAVTPLSEFWLQASPGHFAWPVLAATTLIAVMANASAVRRFTALARAAADPVSTTSPKPAPARRREAAKVIRAS